MKRLSCNLEIFYLVQSAVLFAKGGIKMCLVQGTFTDIHDPMLTLPSTLEGAPPKDQKYCLWQYVVVTALLCARNVSLIQDYSTAPLSFLPVHDGLYNPWFLQENSKCCMTVDSIKFCYTFICLLILRYFKKFSCS